MCNNKPMNYNILVNIVGEYNDYNIIAAMMIKPNKIILINNGSDEEKEAYYDLKKYYEAKIEGIIVVEKIMNKSTEEQILNLLKEYSKEGIAINITGGSKLMSLYFYNIANKLGIDCIYVDVENDKIIKMSQSNIMELSFQLIDMNIEDLITSTGGKILNDNTQLYNDFRVNKIVEYIFNNYDKWKQIKEVMKDKKNIYFHKEIYNRIFINTKTLSKNSILNIISFLKLLADARFLKYNWSYNQIMIDFKSKQGKSILLVSGYWLELITYSVIKSIKSIDDVKSGVSFLWDEDVLDVKNELDVIVAKDSSLTCISCKDSKRYDEEALNELQVYSEKVGGSTSNKVLVATQYPYKKNVVKRAEEMDIKLVIFDGDKQKFEKDIYNAIE